MVCLRAWVESKSTQKGSTRFVGDPSYSSDRFSFSQFVRLYIFFQKSCSGYLDTSRSAAPQPRVLRNRRLLLMPGELICCHHGGLQRSGLVIRCWKQWRILSKLGSVTTGLWFRNCHGCKQLSGYLISSFSFCCWIDTIRSYCPVRS